MKIEEILGLTPGNVVVWKDRTAIRIHMVPTIVEGVWIYLGSGVWLDEGVFLTGLEPIYWLGGEALSERTEVL